MLTVKDLSFHYGKSQILYDINLTAREGQVTCVMGTNGVGKTTLMRAIAGAKVFAFTASEITFPKLPLRIIIFTHIPST